MTRIKPQVVLQEVWAAGLLASAMVEAANGAISLSLCLCPLSVTERLYKYISGHIRHLSALVKTPSFRPHQACYYTCILLLMFYYDLDSSIPHNVKTYVYVFSFIITTLFSCFLTYYRDCGYANTEI